MSSRAGPDTRGSGEGLERPQGGVEAAPAGLFGEDGVHPRVDALVEQAAQGLPVDEIAARIDANVRTAVAASEKRITAHVDEAVLALAEALLRKRSRTGGVGLSAFDTGPIPVVPPAPQEHAPAESEHGHAPAESEEYAPAEPEEAAPPAGPPNVLPTDPIEAFPPAPPEPPRAAAPPAHIDLGVGDGSAESAYQPA